MAIRLPLQGIRWIEISRERAARALILSMIISVPITALAFRLAQLQLVEGTQFRDRAEDNRSRRRPIPAERGPILDRQGKVLATSRLARSAYLSPMRQSLAAWQQFLTPLAGQLDRPVPAILTEIADRQRSGNDDPIRIARSISPRAFVILAEQNAQTAGVWIQSESSRSYPNGQVAAHIIGHIGEADPDDLKANPSLPYGAIVGRTGVERLADDRLLGTWGFDRIESDAKGELGEVLDRTDPIAGDPVQLTLDLPTQRAAAAALAGHRGAAVAIDIKTGGIVAMASNPSFDPNWFVDRITGTEWKALQAPDRPLLNRALQGYPPASTFKIITSIAGMESGAYNPNSRIQTSAAISLGGHLFREHSGSGYGAIGFRDALAYSSNTFYYQIGIKIGPEAIAKWGKILGIGQPLKLGLGGGTVGSLPTPAEKQKLYGQPWYGGDTVSMSIGQGLVLATPLELATVVATVVNGGNRVVPHLLASQVNDPEMKPQPTGINPATLQVVRQGLVDTVKKGTAKILGDGSIPLSGGKTGTAEVPSGRSNAMFVGFAPADRPEIAVAIAVENAGYGGAVAAPIAKEMYRAYFRRPTSAAPAAPPPAVRD